MLLIDMVGMLVTLFLTGLRYPQYVLLATLIHDLANIMAVFLLKRQIQSIVSAGAFGIAVTSSDSGSPAFWILILGPLANYLAASAAGGISFERTANLLNPFAKLRRPFAVINLRLAVFSLLYGLYNWWQ